MKVRMGFVTNSSSSSFIIFGSSRKHLLDTIIKKEIFGEASQSIVDSFKGERVLKGKKLKEYYNDVILYKMNRGREDALNALISDSPYEWMYSAPITRLISKQAGVISEPYLERNVAFVIELGDMSNNEHFGWQAVGYHNTGTKNFDDVILVIGINGH